MQNVLNQPVWSTPGFLGDTSITSTTFGQSTGVVTGGGMGLGARQMYARLGFQF